MAIAYVNRTSAESVGAVASRAATAISHTTGNLLTVFVSRQSATAVTVTDTAGNTYTKIGDVTNNANVLTLYYAYNITGNASNVVTATLSSGTAGYFMLSVRQFSGFGSANPLDDSDSATGTSTTPATPSLTISGTEAVIFAGIEADGQNITAGSGYTLNNFTSAYFADEYKIVTASEAATANATSGDWRIIGAAFKAPSTNTSAFFQLF